MKDKDGYVRDISNPGLVINTDNAALKAYKLQKQKNKKVENSLKEIENIKGEVKEIKQLLNIIIEKLK